MVVIPAGGFTMGSPENEKDRGPDEGPQHEVTFKAPLAVAMHDVTFDQYDACVAAGGCKVAAADAGWGRGRRPVINVNWSDAQEYVKWLSAMMGHTYRLLTEAEWEYSARAGSEARWSFGDDEAKLGDYAWFTGNSDNKTHPIGEKKPNAFGLRDMHGNVWQWLQDCYIDNYDKAPADGRAVTAAERCNHVLRGGSWNLNPRYLRAAWRLRYNSEFRFFNVGFRVARTLISP